MESGGFAKHISPQMGESDVTNRKSNLIGNFVLFCFFTFCSFVEYMWIIKSYNGKVLTVKDFMH